MLHDHLRQLRHLRVSVPARSRRGLRAGALVLATAAVVTAAAPGGATGHLVKIVRGDTLSHLALRHQTSVAELKRLNALRSDLIVEGALLRLPGTKATSGPRPAAAATRVVSKVHVVRPGDNLTVLARRWQTTVAALVTRNHLRRTTIVIGQRLSYPATVRAASVVAAATPTVGGSVGGSVAASAAHHRAVLRARSLPSKAAVRVLIRRTAQRYGVPAHLALALAYQESGFQQRVVSPVDAIGVMQVLPSTGRSLGRLHGRTFDLLKTSDNVEAGVVLLRDLLRATGSTDKALAGYYQGLGSIRAKGLLPQTHQYIKNVHLLQARFR